MTLRLYDPIDSWGDIWGISAKEFVTVLDSLGDDVREIRLLINSPGGEVWEGLAILNALRSHKAKVVAVVEGIAASSASFIAAGVDELWMMPNSELFIHRAWGICLGNAADMEKLAGDLTHEDRNIASIYARKAGTDVDGWLAEMAKDTFYSAAGAVEAGLADRVIEPPKGADPDAASKAKARFDLTALSARNSVSRPSADVSPSELPDPEPLPDPAPELPAAEPEQPINQEDSMSLSEEIRARLGLDGDPDETAILAALDARLRQPAASVDLTPTDPNPEPQSPDTTQSVPPVEPTTEPTTPVAPQLPAGVVAVDESTLNELRRNAQLGAAAHERQRVADRDAAIQAAIDDGKIAPARRAHWVNAWEADPAGAKVTLDSLAPGLVVPTVVDGIVGDPDPEAADALDLAEGELDNWARQIGVDAKELSRG